jgi:hypothetical protein
MSCWHPALPHCWHNFIISIFLVIFYNSHISILNTELKSQPTFLHILLTSLTFIFMFYNKITCTLTLSITQERTCKTCIFVSHSVTCCSNWKSCVNMVSKYCKSKKSQGSEEKCKDLFHTPMEMRNKSQCKRNKG